MSLALPDDSVSLSPELLLVSFIVKRDLEPLLPQPVVLELDELADSHGFVRIRERCLGDWMAGDETSGGGMDEGIGKLFRIVMSTAEYDSVLLCTWDVLRFRVWGLC